MDLFLSSCFVHPVFCDSFYKNNVSLYFWSDLHTVLLKIFLISRSEGLPWDLSLAKQTLSYETERRTEAMQRADVCPGRVQGHLSPLGGGVLCSVLSITQAKQQEDMAEGVVGPVHGLGRQSCLWLGWLCQYRLVALSSSLSRGPVSYLPSLRSPWLLQPDTGNSSRHLMLGNFLGILPMLLSP